MVLAFAALFLDRPPVRSRVDPDGSNRVACDAQACAIRHCWRSLPVGSTTRMLARLIPDKEVPMSEQRVLLRPITGLDRHDLDRCGAEVRRECIAILAQMGRPPRRATHRRSL